MANAFSAARPCAALAVGPLENDAKQNGSAADDEAGKRATGNDSDNDNGDGNSEGFGDVVADDDRQKVNFIGI